VVSKYPKVVPGPEAKVIKQGVDGNDIPDALAAYPPPAAKLIPSAKVVPAASAIPAAIPNAKPVRNSPLPN
jgi:hypothetical protein